MRLPLTELHPFKGYPALRGIMPRNQPYLVRDDDPTMIQLVARIKERGVTQLGDLRKKFNELSQTPVVLTSQIIRVYLSRVIAQFYPDVYVLSFNEITSDVQIQAIGNIALQPQEKGA